MDDLISREEVIKALEAEYVCRKNLYEWHGLRIAKSIIETIPAVNPEPNKGHWIEYGTYGDQYNANYIYKCSYCGRTISDPTTDFCPYCGANMTEKGD